MAECRVAECRIVDLRKIPFAEGLELQKKCWEQRVEDAIPDTLLLLEHNPVITYGTSADDSMLHLPREEIEKKGIEIHEIGRGGRVTYHGPGQLVGYMIRKLPALDIGEHLDKLETLMFETSRHFTPEVFTRTDTDPLTKMRYRGVWYLLNGGMYKIGAVGVSAHQRVTMHGFALNVCTEHLEYFDLIDPCGLKAVKVTTLSEIAGAVSMQQAKQVLSSNVGRIFGYDSVKPMNRSCGLL